MTLSCLAVLFALHLSPSCSTNAIVKGDDNEEPSTKKPR